MIEKCTCNHEYQDRRYGKGNRVFNRAGMADKSNKIRCTVCSREVNLPGIVKEEKSKDKESKTKKGAK